MVLHFHMEGETGRYFIHSTPQFKSKYTHPANRQELLHGKVIGPS